MKKIIVALLCLNLTGCASIIEGSHQEVHVQTNPQSPADCRLSDSKQQTYSVNAPGMVTVNRGDGPLEVNCRSAYGNGYNKVDESLEPWTLGNILLGGLIGITIDGITGAWQKYPDEITVTTSAPAATQPSRY